MMNEKLPRIGPPKPSDDLPSVAERNSKVTDVLRENLTTSDHGPDFPTIASVDPSKTAGSISKKKTGNRIPRIVVMMASIITAGISAVCVAAVILWKVWGLDSFGLFSPARPIQATMASNEQARLTPSVRDRVSEIQGSKPPGKLSLDNTNLGREATGQKNSTPTTKVPFNQSSRPNGSEIHKSDRMDVVGKAKPNVNSAGLLDDTRDALPEIEIAEKGVAEDKNQTGSSVGTEFSEKASELARPSEKSIAESNLLSTLLPLAIELPIHLLAGDDVAYQQYVEELLEAKREQNLAILQLNVATSKILEELSQRLLVKEGAHEDAQLASSIAKSLKADGAFPNLSGRIDSELKSAIKTYENAVRKLDSEFEKKSSVAADQFLEQIDELIRQHSKKVADPKSLARLLQYRELMTLRQASSLQGNFVLLTSGASFPKLYCGGKAIQLGNNGVSKLTRLDVHKDVIAMDVEAIEPGTKLFLAFVTKDLNHQLILRASDVRAMNADADLRRLTKQAVKAASQIARRIEPDSDERKRTQFLQLPSDQGEWFSWEDSARFLAIDGSYSSLVSRHGKLTRKSRVNSGIEIISARFGRGKNWVDVRENIELILDRDPPVFENTPRGMNSSDPMPGFAKQTIITFLINGEQKEVTLQSGPGTKYNLADQLK